MIYIRHRVNRIEELLTLDRRWGAEVDVRSRVDQPNALHLSHDPWCLGDDFEGWLTQFSTLGFEGPLILNTKEDGLETRVFQLLERHHITRYFFLDTTCPTLVRWTMREGRKNFSVRCSRYEPLVALGAFYGKVEWVWVDCFDGEPVTVQDLELLKRHFKVCLVSPELQGRPVSAIREFKLIVSLVDAVCTKTPLDWMRLNMEAV